MLQLYIDWLETLGPYIQKFADVLEKRLVITEKKQQLKRVE